MKLHQMAKNISKLLIISSCSLIFPAQAEVLFYETFDEQPDWTSDDYQRDRSVPEGWFSVRAQEFWSPYTGHLDREPAAQILAANSDKAKGGKGKSYVMYRESGGVPKQWNSDSILAYYLGPQAGTYQYGTQYDPQSGYDEIYFQFDITFSNDFIQRYYDHGLGQGKGGRIYHFDGKELYSFFSGEQNPAFIWDFSGTTTYGMRNFLSFYPRQGPERSYTAVNNPPVQMHRGDMSASYLTTTKGMMPDGSDAKVYDLTKNDGSLLPGPVAHADHVFGDEKQWITMGFYVKMNSAPGVHDGIMMQWLNDQRIMFNDQIAWIDDERNMVKWNIVAIGGNDAYNTIDKELRDEHWFAIDNVLIANHLPNVYAPDASLTPAAPTQFTAEPE